MPVRRPALVTSFFQSLQKLRIDRLWFQTMLPKANTPVLRLSSYRLRAWEPARRAGLSYAASRLDAVVFAIGDMTASKDASSISTIMRESASREQLARVAHVSNVPHRHSCRCAFRRPPGNTGNYRNIANKPHQSPILTDSRAAVTLQAV